MSRDLFIDCSLECASDWVHPIHAFAILELPMPLVPDGRVWWAGRCRVRSSGLACDDRLAGDRLVGVAGQNAGNPKGVPRSPSINPCPAVVFFPLI